MLCYKLESDKNAVLNAAGNIKYIFENEEECKRLTKIFPKAVMEFAPGIMVSQSVVKMDNDMDFSKAVQTLEKNLHTQRNHKMRDLSIGLMGIQRSRQTGLPVTHHRKNDKKEDLFLDSATFHKLYEEKPDGRWKRKETFKLLCCKSFDPDLYFRKVNLPLNDIKEMTGNNDWVAIIHADGNGLGQIVREIGSDKEVFKNFSRGLDKATTTAARRAFKDTVNYNDLEKINIPMRPIVLSGDDHTIICRADLAIPYTNAFLKYFEEETRQELGYLLKGEKRSKPIFCDGVDMLTACAGIAFVKSSFPFHFGYRLAEALCERAKMDTKNLYNAKMGNLPASCIMFHKVQDSFVTDFNDIANRELTPQNDISFEYGPYYIYESEVIKDKRWTISKLLDNVNKLNREDGNAIKNGLRSWLSLLHENREEATQRLKRLIEVTKEKKHNNSIFIESLTNDSSTDVRRKITANDKGIELEVKIYPVYDMLTIHTINNQTTKSGNNPKE